MYCILRGLQVTINMLERSNSKTEWVGAASRSQMSGKHDFCLTDGVSQTLFTVNHIGLRLTIVVYHRKYFCTSLGYCFPFSREIIAF